MKVAIINKSYQTGGAAIAAQRLWRALNGSELHADFLTFDLNKDKENNLINLAQSSLGKLKWWFHFIVERLYFLPFEKDKTVRFLFSPAFSGVNIAKMKEIRNADIIHLNWINQGFLSISSLEKIFETRKPIVITLHDMWYFTGGCHIPMECKNFQSGCGDCFYLKKPSMYDLSSKVFQKKMELYTQYNITFVACSKWMKKNAKSSSLLKNSNVIHIPNPFNVSVFSPFSKNAAREILALPTDKILILFGAANATNKNKGFDYLLRGVHTLMDKNPNLIREVELVILGKSKTNLTEIFPVKVNYLGNLGDETTMAKVYQAADLFVLPTLMDNLPNMVIESMSCETPVVSFNIGGVPEIIDHHKNGYLAEYKSAEDLAVGIEWVLNNNENNALGKAAREKVLREFSEEVVAQQYIDLYLSLLNDKNA